MNSQNQRKDSALPEQVAGGIPVARLNHAVLYVRDLDRSVDFYKRRSGSRRSVVKAA